MQPFISHFDPVQGQPGCVITVHGSGFAAERLDNRVEVRGQECFIVSATPSELRVIAPRDVESGPVEVTTPDGSTAGPHDFTVLGYPTPGSDEDGPPILFDGAGSGSPGDVSPIGTIRVLVALVQPNDTSPANPETVRTEIVNVWRAVQEYYQQVSYGKTLVQFDVFASWTTLDGTLVEFLNKNGDNFEVTQLTRILAQAAQGAVDEGLTLDDYQMMATTMFANSTFLRAYGGWDQQNFSYKSSSVDINITTKKPINQLAIGEIANWGRAAHEFGHNIVSAPNNTSPEGTATLGEDVYGSDLVDPSAATAARFDLMGNHDEHPMFTGFHMERLGYYAAANIDEVQWSQSAFEKEFDIIAHGLAEDSTQGRVHVLKIKIAAGLVYYVQVRQRPGTTTQVFDENIPLDGAASQGGVVVSSVISDTLNTNQQTRFITLLHDPVVLAKGATAEDPARKLKITVVDDAVQTRPLVCRVRVEWAQVPATDPKGTFDLQIEPWDAGYQTPDLWIDRAPFGVFDAVLDSQGRPLGNGDRPKVSAVNHVHARVHVSGPMGAKNVRLTYYAVTPPGVGDNGNWAPIGSRSIAAIPANGFVDAPSVSWVPVLGKHTCLMAMASAQAGEISSGNNAAQENVANFIAAGGSPVDPVISSTAIRNPHDERKLVQVDIRGVPEGWRVQFPHAWVWLDAREEKQLDLIMIPFLDFSSYEKERRKEAQISIRGRIHRDYDASRASETEPSRKEPPGSRLYPIGGVLSNVRIRRRAEIDLEYVGGDEWTIELCGRIDPPFSGQRIRVELQDPAGRMRIDETDTGREGEFCSTFDLRYAPSLEANQKLWKEAEEVEKGTYRAQAEIFETTMAADAISNLVFIER